MTTSLALPPRDVIRLFGYRFKIEARSKNALRVTGAECSVCGEKAPLP